MNRSKELIMAWIANGLSLIFLLFNIISMLLVSGTQNTEQYKQMARQFGGQNVEVTPELIHFGMALSIGVLTFSTVLGIAATTLIKARPFIAACLFVSAAFVGLFNMNLIAMILWFIVAVMLFIKSGNNREKRHKTEWQPEAFEEKKKNNPYIY